MIISTSVCCSCKPNQDDKNIKRDFYGVAFYQKIDGDSSWSTIKNKPSKATNLITTVDDEIIYSDFPATLFYVYSKTTITQNTDANCFTTNTTINQTLIKDNQICFEIEKILECSEMLIYFIYKSNNSYYLSFISYETNITNGTELEFQLQDNAISKVKITFKDNLSKNEKY